MRTAGTGTEITVMTGTGNGNAAGIGTESARLVAAEIETGAGMAGVAGRRSLTTAADVPAGMMISLQQQ
jgi:hypothetical protein